MRLLGKGLAGSPLARRWFPGSAHPLPITCCGSHLPGRLQVAPALCSCSRRRGFERADSEYTDKLQHYTSGHSTYTPEGLAPWDPPLVSNLSSLLSLSASSLAAVRLNVELFPERGHAVPSAGHTLPSLVLASSLSQASSHTSPSEKLSLIPLYPGCTAPCTWLRGDGRLPVPPPSERGHLGT